MGEGDLQRFTEGDTLHLWGSTTEICSAENVQVNRVKVSGEILKFQGKGFSAPVGV